MRTFEAQGQVRDMSPFLLAIVHTAGVFPGECNDCPHRVGSKNQHGPNLS